MSLKTFHIVFIVCSIVMAIGFGYWGVSQYQQQSMIAHLWTGIGSFVLAGSLAVYEIAFVKKNKDIR